MKQIDVYINAGDDELHYKCQVAETEEEKKKGLQGVESLDDDEGMLFPYDKEQKLSFWMKDVKIPLTVVFINEDMEVVAVYDAEPMDETPMVETAKYVLEVKEDEDIEEGDVMTMGLLSDEDMTNLPTMMLLNGNGEIQMEMEGMERIISRKHTETLIRKAKIAKRYQNRSKTKYDKYVRALGRYMFYIIEKQRTQKPEYVED